MKPGSILAVMIAAGVALGGTVWLAGGGAPVEVPEKQENGDVPEPEPERPVVSETGPHPKVAIDEPVFEFDVMQPHETMSNDFTIRNDGEAPLILQAGNTSCKCTKFELASTELAPGESTIASLSWKPELEYPKFEQIAEIHTNDPDNTMVKLTVNGMVESTVKFEPELPWNIGTISETEPTTFTAKAYSRVVDEFEIVSLESRNPHISAAIRPAEVEELPTGVKLGFNIDVTVSPAIPVGNISEQLTIALKDKKEYSIEAAFNGNRHGPYKIVSATPGLRWQKLRRTLDFGEFSASEGNSGRFFLFLSGDVSKLELESVTPAAKDIEVSFEPDLKLKSDNRKRYIVSLSVAPGAPRNRREDNSVKLTIKSKGSDINEFEVRVAYLSI